MALGYGCQKLKELDKKCVLTKEAKEIFYRCVFLLHKEELVKHSTINKGFKKLNIDLTIDEIRECRNWLNRIGLLCNSNKK